jgi:cysteine-rich repeat protein
MLPRTLPSTFLLPSVLLLALVALTAPAGATVPADLCVGNPCQVTDAKLVDPNSVLDFPAGTNLVLKTGSVVSLAGNGVARGMTIRAATITLEPGARIVALPIPDGPISWGNATLSLEATDGDLTLQNSGSTLSRIDGQGNWATSVSLSATGSLIVNGAILVNGTGSSPYGGDLELVASGDVIVSTDLATTASGADGDAGEIAIDAGGDVMITGAIDTSGSPYPGEVAISSLLGDVSVAEEIDTTATRDGSGGPVTVSAAAGTVAVGRITGNGSSLGSGDNASCGDGASITLVAGGGVTLADDLSARGGGTTCAGGAIDLSAGEDVAMAVGVEIDAAGSGTEGYAGSLVLYAGRDATVRTVDLSATADSGSIEATAKRLLEVVGTIDARASGSEAIGGEAILTGCTLNLAVGASIDVRGDDDDSGIWLTSSGQMTVAGTLRSDFENRLIYRSAPPITAGATIVLAPVLDLQPGLPPCLDPVECGDGGLDAFEVCDDGNRVSCDGCANDCMRVDDVCGDGTRECSEQCDDGNTTSGDGCQADCTLPAIGQILVPGTPLVRGCQAEWKFFLSNPEIDAGSGLPKRTQKCTDGDPACDSDGVNDLACTYEVQLCLRADDPRIPECNPGALDYLRLGTPNPNSGDPVSAQNGQAILGALEPLDLEVQVGTTVVQTGAPFVGTNQCTESFAITVPRTTGSTGKRAVRVSAKDVTGGLMQSNQMSLTCAPNPSVCGNGAVETFEQCDDDNTDACDGCSPSCRLEVCGDGLPSCDEQCDDGAANGTPGSRCSTSCTEVPPALRVPGGGSKSLDCGLEWSAEMPAGRVLVDKAGLPKNAQRCTDGDPACDFDPTPGRCGMRLWACLGGADARLACAAQQIDAVDVTSPRTNVTGTQLAARNALVAAVGALGLPAGPGEECSQRVEVEIPVNKSLRLGTRTTSSVEKRDTDSLKLFCRATP